MEGRISPPTPKYLGGRKKGGGRELVDCEVFNTKTMINVREICHDGHPPPPPLAPLSNSERFGDLYVSTYCVLLWHNKYDIIPLALYIMNLEDINIIQNKYFVCSL